MAELFLTKKHRDLSTDKMMQYELICDRCGEGFITQKTRKSLEDSELENNIKELVNGVRNEFRHCKGCNKWVCRKLCWDALEMQCEKCAKSSIKLSDDGDDEDSYYSSILGDVDEL